MTSRFPYTDDCAAHGHKPNAWSRWQCATCSSAKARKLAAETIRERTDADPQRGAHTFEEKREWTPDETEWAWRCPRKESVLAKARCVEMQGERCESCPHKGGVATVDSQTEPVPERLRGDLKFKHDRRRQYHEPEVIPPECTRLCKFDQSHEAREEIYPKVTRKECDHKSRRDFNECPYCYKTRYYRPHKYHFHYWCVPC